MREKTFVYILLISNPTEPKGKEHKATFILSKVHKKGNILKY